MAEEGIAYGGTAWYEQLQQAIADLVNAELSKQLGTGYVTTDYRGAPTEEEALHAIWNNRPDLKTFYDKLWGKDNYEPIHAVRNWMEITDEEAVTALGRDPLAYALDRGYVLPGQEETTEKTVERESMEANRALQYMNLLAQVKGPRDWVTYSNLQRASANTQFPEWARALSQGLGLSPFQGGAVEGQQDLTSWLGLTQSPTQAQGYLPQAQAQGGYGGGYLAPAAAQAQAQQPVSTWQSAYIQPHYVRPQQYANMAPSEQEMLAGLVESQGGVWEDWVKKMQAAAPTGAAKGTSYFTGW